MYYQQYVDSQRRIEALVSPLDAGSLDVLVPACPAWSVHDVLAHLAGSAASFGTESFAGVGSDAWTREHVESRRSAAVADLLAERWKHTPALQQVPADSPAWLPILHDALTHEADIRNAIGAPRLPADVLAAAFGLIVRALPRQLGRLGSVELELDGQLLTVGDGSPDLAVQAPRYEFWRGWYGRRSPNQMRGWVRHGDADAFAEALPVFPARSTDLYEPA